MRLLGCHIENFGKLQDFTIDFEENPTVVNERNGWGKSTLASFIKVMFYGFAGEKKRGDVLERERVRFRPWQGGVCGGEIRFEAGGKRYLLNRTFGAKEADDTFALYDAATNLLSEDFSRNIGEELFQINQESFLRTVYIAQSDCVTGTTDSINAKVGNLADNLDDINNYEKVQQRLKDLKNSLTPARKTGALRKLRDEIDGLKNEVRKKSLVEGAIAELEAKLEDCDREKEAARREQNALQEELMALSRQKETAAKKEQYEKILRQCGERQAALETCEEFFGGRAPQRAQLQQIVEKHNVMLRRESDRQANALGAAEEIDIAKYRHKFMAGMPGEELFTRGRELSEQLDDLRREAARRGFSAAEEQEADDIRNRLGGRRIREEDIDHYLRQWNLRGEIKGGLGTKRATLRSLRAVEESGAARERRRKRAAGIGSFLFSLCLVLAGVGLYVFEPVAGMILSAAGAVAAAVSLALHVIGGRRKTVGDNAAAGGAAALEREIAQDEETMAKAQEEVLHFLDRLGPGAAWEGQGVRDILYGLKDDLKRLGRLEARQQDYRALRYEERIAAAENELRTLLQPYYTAEEIAEKNAGDLLTDLDGCRRICLQLSAKEDRYRQADAECAALQAEIHTFLAEYGQGEAQDTDAALGQMSQRLAGYEKDLEELERCRNERAEFEHNYDTGSFREAVFESLRDTDEVKVLLQAAAKRQEIAGENRNSYLAQLDERQQEAEQLELAGERLGRLEEQYEKEYLYYCNLERTSEYLAKAKESFSARYMEPIMSAFRRNFEEMSRISGEDFRIDANIRITKREVGEQRDTKALSAGSQDLIGICLRMALIEAMYQKERPFLIFDDSFINLDDEKLGYAKEFLRGAAERYQIIYFTCHGSRALEQEMI